jgi:oligosaccharyltransferase complex subunit beta
LTANVLLQFINNKGNILLTLSATAPTPTAISSLLLELDIHLPDRTTLVVDHFNYDTLSASENTTSSSFLDRMHHGQMSRTSLGCRYHCVSKRRRAGAWKQSPYLAPILRAPNTAYSYNPKDEVETVEEPFATGQQMALVSTMQARNSARFTVLGSVEMLENTWFEGKIKERDNGKETTTTNRDFAKELSAWTFMEIGVLKVGRVEHYLSSTTAENAGNDSMAQLGYLNPKIYRVKNDVVSCVTQNSKAHDPY